jgi:hypothetical protein
MDRRGHSQCRTCQGCLEQHLVWERERCHQLIVRGEVEARGENAAPVDGLVPVDPPSGGRSGQPVDRQPTGPVRDGCATRVEDHLPAGH